MFETNLCKILLPEDRVHSKPADIGETIKSIPVIDRIIEVDVALMITVVSTDSEIVLKVL